MAKFIKVINLKGVYVFNCPGCNASHSINTEDEGYPHPIWSFNNNVDKPTISPSLLVRYPANPNATDDFKEWRKERICHSFIKDGNIQFLGDCTHDLAGKTVEIPDFD